MIFEEMSGFWRSGEEIIQRNSVDVVFFEEGEERHGGDEREREERERQREGVNKQRRRTRKTRRK